MRYSVLHFFKGFQMKKLALLFIALLSVSALADDLPRIAVYVTGNVGDDEKKALGTRMLASLINSKRYKGIERSNSFLAEIEKEQIKQRSGEIDDSQISELGRQFGVKFVCIADITPVLGDFQISARIVDVETAEVVFIGEAFSQMKTTTDLAQVSDQVVKNMFSEQTKTEPKIEPAVQEPPPAISQAKVKKPKPEPKPKPKPEPKPKTEPMEIIESKYRSMQKGISLEMGGTFVPFSYYDESVYSLGHYMGGGGYMSIDLIYVEMVLDIAYVIPDVGTEGMAVILAKYPIVYEMINVSPIFGFGTLGPMVGERWIFGGKIDVGISEIAYLHSEYLYGFGFEGWGASFKVGGGLDIGLGERKKTYLRTELLYNWMGGEDEYEKQTIHYLDLRLGIGYKW